MFADPLGITVNGVAKNLTRIRQDSYSSEYLLRTATEEYRFNIRNSTRPVKGKGVLLDRHNVEIVHTVFAVAPSTRSYVRKAYFVLDNEQGDTLNDPQYIASALVGFLTAANITKMLNFES